MLQSLLGQLDAGFARASSASASSSAAAKALFDRARGIYLCLLRVVLVLSVSQSRVSTCT
jgi:hypothetical protein